MRTFHLKRLTVVVLLFIFTPALTSAQQDAEKSERGFVASVAAMVYNLAWPSATYKDWKVKSVERRSGGIDLTARLTGESAFGGELWLDLVFQFRNGSFSDLAIAGHNAILVPPFETSKAIGAVAMDLMNSEANRNRVPAPPESPSPPRPSLSAPPELKPIIMDRGIRTVSRCGHPVSLWVRVKDPQARWRNVGAWSLKNGSNTLLADGSGTNLRLSSATLYYYAEISGSTYTWQGTERVQFGEQTLPMQAKTLGIGGTGDYELTLTCENYVPPKAPTYFVGFRGQDIKEAVIVNGRTLNTGVRVAGLMHGYPGQAAGLQVGDILTAVDGQAIQAVTDLQRIVSAAGARSVILTVHRPDGLRSITLTPAPALVRQTLDYAQCRAAGNPPDYYYGAVAVPFKSPSGDEITPLYPGTSGRLFDPGEVDIYVRSPNAAATADTSQAFVFHGKSLRDDITGFEYRDADRVMLVTLASGERLDLGVRIQCLIQPGIVKATQIRLSRTRDNKEISHRMLPLRVVE